MNMIYKLIDDGKLSKTELATLYDNENPIGDLLIMYQSNGIKNMAYIERVFIHEKYRGEGYGPKLISEVVKHIEEEYTLKFDTSCLEDVIISDANDIKERLISASKSGINEIYLKCYPELAESSLYTENEFVKTDSVIMSKIINELDYSSLE